MLTDRKEEREWGWRGRDKGIGERVARRPLCALGQRAYSLEKKVSQRERVVQKSEREES